jgi:TorA maturation chaperone TorD
VQAQFPVGKPPDVGYSGMEEICSTNRRILGVLLPVQSFMQSRKGQMPTLKTEQVIHRELPILPPIGAKDKHDKALGQVYRARALSSPTLRSPPNLWQQQIDSARARAFVYRFLAKAFTFPRPDDWQWLCNPTIQTVFCSAVKHALLQENAVLRRVAAEIVHNLHPGQFEGFLDEHVAFFTRMEWAQFAPGRSSGASEYSQEEFTELEALLKSFGLQMTDWPSRPSDLLCAGLEFISWLQTREAELLERGEEVQANVHRRAQKRLSNIFLEKWAYRHSPKADGLLGQLLVFAKEFVVSQTGAYEWTPPRLRQDSATRAALLHGRGE